MGAISVRLFGPFEAAVDGEAVRFRTQQQILLLARLAADDAPVDRRRLARSLWPEASPENGLAYLRRATMELRRLGFAVGSGEAGLVLERTGVSVETEGGGEALEGIAHPLADEIRGLLKGHVQTSPTSLSEGEHRDLLPWLAELMLQHDPKAVLKVMVDAGRHQTFHLPPQAMLDLYLRVVEANPEPSDDRSRILVQAARCAKDLTRYGQANRLYEQVVEDCKATGFAALRSIALRDLAQGKIMVRDWPAARRLLDEALEQAEISGVPSVLSAALSSISTMQQDTLDFEGAMATTLRAAALSDSDDMRMVDAGNLCVLAALYGVEMDLSLLPPLPQVRQEGYIGFAEAVYRFALGVLYGIDDQVREGATRQLKLTSELKLETSFCMALDFAAVAFARSGHPHDAAVCVRLGTAVRAAIDHRRTPGDLFMLRRFVAPPFFGAAIQDDLRSLNRSDSETMARVLIARLESL